MVQPLPGPNLIFQVTVQPTEVIHQQHLELLRLGICEHLLVARALGGAAANGAVGISVRDRPAFPCRAVLAVADLIVNAGLLLPVAGKPCVDRAAYHGSVLLPVTSPR